MAIIKRWITTNVGEDEEKSESPYFVDGKVNGAAALENSLAVTQNVKRELLYDPIVPPMGIY